MGFLSDCRARDGKFKFQLGHVTFVELDHEINSTIILTLLLIQEGELSVTGKSLCKK